MKSFYLPIALLLLAFSSCEPKKESKNNSKKQPFSMNILKQEYNKLTDTTNKFTEPIPYSLAYELILKYNFNARNTLQTTGNNTHFEVVSLSCLSNIIGNFNDTVKFYFLSINKQLRLGIAFNGKTYITNNTDFSLIDTLITDYAIDYNTNEKLLIDSDYKTQYGQSRYIKVSAQELQTMINLYTSSLNPADYLGIFYSQVDSTINPSIYNLPAGTIPPGTITKFNDIKSKNHNNISIVFLPLDANGKINTNFSTSYDVSDICPPTCNN